jgi:hypothetical protein
MGYKILGFVVWRGLKWYLRRRVDPKVAMAAAGGLLAAGAAIAAAVAAQRHSGDSE